MKTLFALLLIFSLCAFAQQAPTFTTGQSAPAIGTCADPVNVGNFYNQTGDPANGFSGLYVCQQTGSYATLRAGAFTWVPLASQPGTATTGTISVANGKAASILKSLTFTGTDTTTMTFPTTSATIARTDAANTFTGVQTMTLAALTTPVITTDAHCATAGGCTLGTAALPASSAYIGGAATNNFQVTGTATGARVVTLPDVSITVPGTVVNQCGTTNTCSPTLVSSTSKIVVGHSATLNGASPSIATIASMPAFTSQTSYVCTGTVESASASTIVLAVNYVSSSSVTFTAANGATGVVSYVCLGN